ncbi:M14 family metallopeptidase [Ferroacidibacillus organovorans]|uniref:Peptidase M14 n=1 Tax=Ferroacidibacillus organovorans TaxID=1765683 RepID=A0A853KAA3_9BACL|nr:M14 family metallopeptidase [Ferroacidibacillus organovorans]KYP80013.1 peptidase M14 [Ferroacidibacillus organovorans]OAG92995.1 peptidase M14 [Ferroacidibacillus organovorans]
MKALYWGFTAMWDELSRLAQKYPTLMRVEVMGTSREGRAIPVVTLTQFARATAEEKSAVLVDANIHAGEVTGNAAAMYWITQCLEMYGNDQEITALLDDHTVYVVPRLSVDGAEAYLTTPAWLRSSPHTYPYSAPPEGFYPDDVNGDGVILHMRIPAEDGAFVPDELDPRVMRQRRPGEIGGTYYHVFPEGRIHRQSRSGDLPPFARAYNRARSGMDFNRNFPIRWANEAGQDGAGPFPLSEPELRCFAQWIIAHPNIAAYAALHTSGGVILRQPSTGDDTVLSSFDRLLFTRVADMGAEASGYFAGSNFEKFATGHEAVLMPGAADDWMYDHLGILGFTIELWDLAHRAGARGYGEYGMRHMIQRTPDERTDDERKIYAWVDREAIDQGVFPWTAFHHPDFGDVEIGGLHPKYVIQNPPLHLLEEECARISPFLTRLGLSTPKLRIPYLRVTKEADHVYRVVAEVANGGFLPTTSTEKGKTHTLDKLTATLEGTVEFLSGSSPYIMDHLDGYGGRDAWATPIRQRGVVEWVVRGASDEEVTISFFAPRAGRVSRSFRLSFEA